MTRIPIDRLPSAQGKYSPFELVDLEDRTWPSKRLTKAPVWCSVDLRDGNQALVEPMGAERKSRLFEALVAMGFKEIEIGFPSASKTDYDFTRSLVDHKALQDQKDPVWLQVLTQAREDLIIPTHESIKGYPRAIVHLYNSTSTLQRELVFKRDRKGIIEIAVRGAELVRKYTEKLQGTKVRWQYSPESFTGTELDFALEICEAVMDVWEPSKENPVILNLPATVEMSTPNVHADQIEWFGRHLKNRESAILSLHPHNDRGTAVAAAELALMAGAERVEGTLFGNGERTGNVDLITMALNLHSQGVDPKLALGNIKAIRELAEFCTQLPVHPRHPYAGDLVFTAFSGSHQDAIKKGMSARKKSNDTQWRVPYFPIDPGDIGRQYEPIIRINSQSGKGGIAYIMESEFDLELPRALQVEFSRIVQESMDKTGTEFTAQAIWDVFDSTYLNGDDDEGFVYQDHKILNRSAESKHTEAEFQLKVANKSVTLRGTGNGPLDALVSCVNQHFGWRVEILDYHQHALGHGASAKSATYLEMQCGKHKLFGVGLHTDIGIASMRAAASGIDRFIHAGALKLNNN